MKDIPPGLRIEQVAIVVRDLWKTMEMYHKTFGWGPWSIWDFKEPVIHDVKLRGKPAKVRCLAAEVHVNPIDFELIQPIEGGLYQEFLEEKGEGFHHLAVAPVSGDVDDMLKDFKKRGIGVLMSGVSTGDSRWYYLDTEPRLKLMAEVASKHSIGNKPQWTYP